MNVITVNGAQLQGYTHLKKDTLQIMDIIEARTTGQMTVVDDLGAQSYVRGMPVTVYDDASNLVFAGFVDKSKARRIAPTSTILEHDITLMDNHYLADKRIVAASYATPLTCGYIARDILTNYLAAEGVTEGLIQDGATLNTCVFNYVSGGQCYDELATDSNFIWYISYDKKLYFCDRNSLFASFALTSNMMFNTSLTNDNPKYRNQQYVRGAKSTTSLQTESQKGDGVSRAFTVSYPLAKVPTAITVNSVAKTIGIKGIDTGNDFYWAKSDAVIAQDTGGTLLTSSDTFQIQYYGEYEIVVVATSDDQVAAQLAIEGSGTGIVEEVEVANTVTDQPTAINDALALLEEYAQQGQQFECTIYQPGLKTGQMVTVTNAAYGLNAVQMLIEQIKTTRQNNVFQYDVIAVLGPSLGNWSTYFKKLESIGKSFVTDVNLGTGNLVRLKQLSETWTDTETLTPTVWACPVCGNSTYCGDSTIVC